MVKITDELLISRAEHNDGSLATLEEIALHQQKLEKIEYINRVCAKLKILQLQDNCIEKIENLGRMKCLEYLNLAMNNIEHIVNLEKLESLNKLDLTLNFIGELTIGLESLKHLENFHHLYLMGNPCTEFPNYRQYVIGTLKHLKTLDGTEVSKSERIQAVQDLPWIRIRIEAAELAHRVSREGERRTAEAEIASKRLDYDDPSLSVDERRRRFFQSSSRHTPEHRKESQRFREILDFEEEQAKNERDDLNPDKIGRERRPRRLFDDNGRPLNVNEAGIEFDYDDSDPVVLRVEVKLWKHLDPTQVSDLTLEPWFLRLTIKKKVFQLRFLEEVLCDRGEAKRSQASGHLTVTVPKMNPEPTKPALKEAGSKIDNIGKNKQLKSISERELLEATGWNDCMDFSRIARQDSESPPPLEDIE